MNRLLNNKKVLIIFASGIVLIMLVVVVSSLFSSPSAQQTETAHVVTPMVPLEKSSQSVITHIEDKKQLSTSDSQGKALLIKQVTSPDYTSTAEYLVEYVPGIDFFHVQITTIEIEKARHDAMNWFLSQGISSEGLCSLPVVFYLSPDIATRIQGTTISFNALPDGCK